MKVVDSEVVQATNPFMLLTLCRCADTVGDLNEFVQYLLIRSTSSQVQDQVTVASYDLPLEKTPDASAKHEQKNAGDA